MKISRIMLLLAVPLLFSCLPKKPVLLGTEVPAGPLVEALEQQRRSLTSLKAVASLEIVRRGRRRAFDSVGVVFDDRRRLRLEAVGPLGMPIITLVWDDKEITVRLPDGEIKKPGQAGLERILGLGVEAQELCAVLSGTAAGPALKDARAFCAKDGVCVVEVTAGDLVRHFSVSFPGPSSPAGRLIAQELFQGDHLLYRARYEREYGNGRGPLPRTVIIENPEKQVVLTLEYAEADINVPVAEEAFTLEGEHGP
ncbi:MAG TPA: hypothetical protein VIX18_09120 [Nitrospirota bacterium]